MAKQKQKEVLLAYLLYPFLLIQLYISIGALDVNVDLVNKSLVQ